MDPAAFLLAANFGVTDAIWIVLVVLLIALSAFFSSSETAFSSVNTMHIKNYADEKVKGARRAQYICDHFDMALVCFLVGNNLVNIANTTICAYLFTKFILNPTLANILNTVIMTILILIFGEILPKSYAKHNPEKYVLKFSGVIFVFMKICSVIAYPFYRLQKRLLKEKEVEKITEDDFESIVDTMEYQGVIDSDNAEIIHGALDISEKMVKDILVPRVDVIAAPETATLDELKKIFIEWQFTRIPIYSGDKDNIIGILNYKDLMMIEYSNKKFNIEKIIYEPLKVNETMKVDELIRTMQKEKMHLAVVVDEYGGTSGIVTMEDALEEMVGEIYDEHDDEAMVPIKKLSENKFRVNPNISVEDLFKFLEIEHLPETQYSSVGGLVYEHLETLPEKGTSVTITAVDDVLDEHNNYVSMIADLKFTVEKVEDDRITQILLEVNRRSSNDETEEKEQ
ncbi:MAG: HlyC/CorC family transporter [Clostridia bacterium]|nr:HlyC/CorC family transporter [Clostridia bacterium]